MELPGQLTYGIRSLLRYPPASVVAFAAECSPDCVSAREALEAVASQALPPLLSPAKPTRADHTGTTSN
jgi:hypothetical protein